MLTQETRKNMVRLAMKLLGVPYIWGGSTVRGWDCSGFLVWIYQVFDLLPAGDWTAQSLSQLVEATSVPQPGDPVFYGRDTGHVTHVMMYAGESEALGQMVVGASGGDSKTTTMEAAALAGACVKMKPARYRRDYLFIGDAERLDV